MPHRIVCESADYPHEQVIDGPSRGLRGIIGRSALKA
jgi:hypothetical protein